MRFLLFLLLAAAARAAASDDSIRALDSKRYHLGVAGNPEWTDLSDSPHGPRLELTFTAEPNAAEQTLFLWQENVKITWNVTLNGRKLGALETMTQPLVRALPIPAGVLKSGANQLTIARIASPLLDDIVVGDFRLDSRSRDDALAATLVVAVRDGDTGTGLPCRLTLTDPGGALQPLRVTPGVPLAARTGVVYTGNGEARMAVAAGEYVLHAGRGFEYSVATERFRVAAGETKPIALQIRREVPTPGFIASDTHIHTLTYSKHGDATIDERMLTIAGEGIELAVATDHNHHTDYTEPAAGMGVSDHFRSVVGNEVTTRVGHFNAFPIPPGSAVPDFRLTDWTRLLSNIRRVTGAKVVTLNHPRDLHEGFTPFAPANFDATTGALKGNPTFDCDAVEVVTSAAMQSDILQLFHDWFALVNHGYRIAAIAASDTHNVSEFILGQARTYVACRAGTPAEIDLDEVCESYRHGRLLVSLGLLAEMTVNGRFQVGDVVAVNGRELEVAVEVRGPSWVAADHVELFANGIKVREQAIAPTDEVVKTRVRWTLPAPAHDLFLVAIATGPGVTAPYWEIPRPYQPASKKFTSRILGATNAIWIDADGDGTFTCARGYAANLVRSAGHDGGRLIASLAAHDGAVAVQAADLWREARNDFRDPALIAALREAPAALRAAFAAPASQSGHAR